MQLQKIKFVVAVVGAICAAILAALIIAVQTPLNNTHSIYSILGSFFVYLPFCIAGELLFGLPIFLILTKFKITQWWIWLPLSATLGLFIGLLFGGRSIQDFEIFAVAIFASIASAAIFRLALIFQK